MHSFLCFSKIGSLHDIDLYLGLLSLENCDFDSKQLSLPVAISACRAAPMGANPLGHTFKPLTLYDISIYTIYFSHPWSTWIRHYGRSRVKLKSRLLFFRAACFFAYCVGIVQRFSSGASCADSTKGGVRPYTHLYRARRGNKDSSLRAGLPRCCVLFASS